MTTALRVFRPDDTPASRRVERFRRLGDMLEEFAAFMRDEAEREAAEAADAMAAAARRRDDDPMLTVAEAAVELRRSRAFVRGLCQSGAIAAMGGGPSGYRIRRSAIEKYERKRTK